MTVHDNLFADSPEFFRVCQETKDKIKDSFLISHPRGSETSGLKISQMCPNVSIDHYP